MILEVEHPPAVIPLEGYPVPAERHLRVGVERADIRPSGWGILPGIGHGCVVGVGRIAGPSIVGQTRIVVPHRGNCAPTPGAAIGSGGPWTPAPAGGGGPTGRPGRPLAAWHIRVRRTRALRTPRAAVAAAKLELPPAACSGNRQAEPAASSALGRLAEQRQSAQRDTFAARPRRLVLPASGATPDWALHRSTTAARWANRPSAVATAPGPACHHWFPRWPTPAGAFGRRSAPLCCRPRLR